MRAAQRGPVGIGQLDARRVGLHEQDVALGETLEELVDLRVGRGRNGRRHLRIERVDPAH